jgi:hypothetical protein
MTTPTTGSELGPRESTKAEQITLGGSLSLSALVTFPAAAALFLGVLYGVGALSRSAELHHAGVPVSVALPLIPLAQELGRGIQIFVQPIVLLLAPILAVAFVAWDLLESREQSPQSATPRILVGFLVGIVLVGAIVRPVLTGGYAVGVATAMLVIVLAAPEGQRRWLFRRSSSVRIRPALVLAAIISALGTSAIIFEFLSPSPLPAATLSVSTGSPVTGDLIVFGDGTWYLTARHGQIQAIDGRTVTSALIVVGRRRSDVQQQDLFQLTGI